VASESGAKTAVRRLHGTFLQRRQGRSGPGEGHVRPVPARGSLSGRGPSAPGAGRGVGRVHGRRARGNPEGGPPAGGAVMAYSRIRPEYHGRWHRVGADAEDEREALFPSHHAQFDRGRAGPPGGSGGAPDGWQAHTPPPQNASDPALAPPVSPKRASAKMAILVGVGPGSPALPPGLQRNLRRWRGHSGQWGKRTVTPNHPRYSQTVEPNRAG
jgi:hypothetical protein